MSLISQPDFANVCGKIASSMLRDISSTSCVPFRETFTEKRHLLKELKMISSTCTSLLRDDRLRKFNTIQAIYTGEGVGPVHFLSDWLSLPHRQWLPNSASKHKWPFFPQNRCSLQLFVFSHCGQEWPTSHQGQSIPLLPPGQETHEPPLQTRLGRFLHIDCVKQNANLERQ